MLTFLRNRMDRLCTEEYGYGLSTKLNLPFDVTEYLMETQNLLMEEVFEQDFEKVENLESAKKFFEKLRGYETVITKVASEDRKTCELNIDNSYKDFYQKKLQEMAQVLEERGVDKAIIEKELLEEYKYKRQPCL